MEALSIYKKKYHVDYGDSDYYKKLRISSLFNYLQDIASLHSENIGLGIEHLQQEYGVAWVMVRIMVQIEKCPAWNDEIIVETWPIEPKKLEFERDFIVKDSDGNILIRAISSWVIMDIEKREIRKSELIRNSFDLYTEERAINQRMGKLKPNGQLELVYKKLIGYSDIDINGHLNNSKYIDYITDCFSIDKHGKYTVESIRVSYIGEALAGDTIAFYRDISALDSGDVYVEGIDEISGKVYFKANVAIK